MTLPSSARRVMPAVALLISACAGSVTSYPSLAPRTVERDAEAGAGASTTIAPVDAATAARAAALVATADDGQRAFDAAALGACAAIARGAGAAEGSEAWVAGQQALSAVEASRAPTARALDDLNALVLEQARLAEAGAKEIDLSPLLADTQRVAALDVAQRERLAGLSGGCRS